MPQAQVPAFLEDGEVRTDFVPTIADISAPTVEELNATGNLPLSIWMTNADGFKIDHTQDFVPDDREAYAAAGQIPGVEKFENGALQVVDNTNKGEGVPNLAVETLTKGTKGYFVRRRGKTVDEPYEAGDVVSVYAVTIGIKTAVAHGENQRQLSTISFAADPSSKDETAIVAGTTDPGL